MIVFDVIIVLLILIIGYNFTNRFLNLNAYDKSILKKLFYYHVFFAIVFYAYILNYGGDSTNYWFVTYYDSYDYSDVLDVINRGSATGIMLIINYIPAKLLGLSFFTGTLIYALLGYFGFVYFYAILRERIPNWNNLLNIKILRISIFPTFLFLPNMHFWTGGISKDTLIFFSIGLFAYSLLKVKTRFFGILISLLLTFFIRPHITLFMVAAFGLGYFFDGDRKPYQKVLAIMIFVIGFAALLSKVQEFIKIESFEADAIESFSNRRASNLSNDGIGSAVDISNYPLPLKIFTFLYRPLFFDGFSPLNLISSFENLLLLLFTLKIFKNKSIKAFNRANFIFKGFLFLFILGSIAFSLILGNLGIMMRQKTPFVVSLIIFGFYTLNDSMNQATIKKSMTKKRFQNK
jgi:hypothetical protein